MLCIKMAAGNFVVLTIMVILATSNTASSNVVSVQIPEECKDKSFCFSKSKGYDELEEKINAALPQFLKQEYGQRDNDVDTDEEEGLSPESDWHNCPYETIVKPYNIYKYDNKTIDHIVQTSLFSQKIKEVRCAHEKISPTDKNNRQECFQALNLKANALRSTCKTIIAKRNLYVYNEKTKQIYTKKFPIRVCCSCTLRRTFKTLEEE